MQEYMEKHVKFYLKNINTCSNRELYHIHECKDSVLLTYSVQVNP